MQKDRQKFRRSAPSHNGIGKWQRATVNQFGARHVTPAEHRRTSQGVPMRVASRTVFDFVRPDGATAPVETELLYQADDPFAVTMKFHAGGAVATWIMGRDLLAEGLSTPSGRGDVRLRPNAGRTLVLELISDRHVTVFRLPAGTLRKFLDATYRLVPPGTEHFDADAFLGTVLR
jgi:hypothetical protein